ncbi:hypothetical protein CDV36_010559 [Fusarium kuroshium]|uniref:Uncharacterized protein n=1 Tax=Fusarium kuroshium TaxID=2010991 RepID=A0A3M2RWY3_9HYPO|nr:hypothetical protein CDV36_010559 [Fusarium kuroshium]
MPDRYAVPEAESGNELSSGPPSIPPLALPSTMLIQALQMCTWKKTLCEGKGGTCQTEFSRYIEKNCGKSCKDLDATGWTVVREDTCTCCKYATPPDSPRLSPQAP